MKNRLIPKILMGFCVTLFAINLAAQELVVVYNEAFPPYSFEVAGKLTGIEIDLMDELGKRIGLKISHRALPWERAQYEVRSGMADAFITARTPDRKGYADMSFQPFLVVKMVGVTAKNNPRIAGLMKLKTLAESQAYGHVNYFGSR